MQKLQSYESTYNREQLVVRIPPILIEVGVLYIRQSQYLGILILYWYH